MVIIMKKTARGVAPLISLTVEDMDIMFSLFPLNSKKREINRLIYHRADRADAVLMTALTEMDSDSPITKLILRAMI